MLHLRGELADEQAAVVVKALEQLTDRLDGPIREAGLLGDPGDKPARKQAQADALVELASTCLQVQADAVRATVVVHVDAEVFNDLGSGIASLADGPVIAGKTAIRMACDSHTELLLDGPDGPIGIGRRSRTVPGWLWRVLKHRDHTCRFPGCERTRWMQATDLLHLFNGDFWDTPPPGDGKPPASGPPPGN